MKKLGFKKKDEILERIFKSLEVYGFRTMKEVARKFNMSYHTVRSYLTGERKMSQEFLQRIAELGINLNWIFTGQGSMFTFPEPAKLVFKLPDNDEFTVKVKDREKEGKEISFFIVPKVKARLLTGSEEFETNAEIIAYYAFRSDWLLSKTVSPQSIVLMDVSGDSMHPLIRHGDTVMVDQSQTKLVQGHIYAFGFGEEIVIKILDRLPDAILLKSYNPAYSDISLGIREWQDKIKIIGRVIWSCRDY